MRLLASARFVSQSLLCIVLAGDARLLDKLRREELIPLGSHTRLATGTANREELLACLEHLLAAAGNYRIFIAMAAELLMTAAQRDITVLDEKLYLQIFAPPHTQPPRRTAAEAR